jgi:hypothetical protein
MFWVSYAGAPLFSAVTLEGGVLVGAPEAGFQPTVAISCAEPRGHGFFSDGSFWFAARAPDDVVSLYRMQLEVEYDRAE